MARTRKSVVRRLALAALALGVVAVSSVLGAAGWMLSYDTVASTSEESQNALVIQDVTVVDVETGALRPHLDVWVRAERIDAIDPTGADVGNATVISGAGKFVVPGLIDMHNHILGPPNPPWELRLANPNRNLEQLLYAGVTTIFDPGDMTPEIFELRDDIASGEVLGPTIYAAGPVFAAPGGHPGAMMRAGAPDALADVVIDRMTREITTVEDAHREVAALAPLKPDFIKFVFDEIPDGVPRLEDSLPAALVAAARKHQIRPVAHIGSTEDAIVSGEAGATAWIHGVYREPVSDEDAIRLAGFGIPMVATLVVFKSFAELGTDERVATDLEREMADPDLLASFESVPDDYEYPQEMIDFRDMLREQRRAGLDNVRKLHAAGVQILAGSDQQYGMIPGASLHRELLLLQQAGLTPLEVLLAATLHPARFLEETADPSFGVVRPGAVADLMVVNANPLEDVRALSDIDAVVLQGRPLIRYSLAGE